MKSNNSDLVSFLFRFGHTWRLIFFSWVSKRFFFPPKHFSTSLAGAAIYCRSFGCKQIIFGTITKYFRYLTSAELVNTLKVLYLTKNGSHFIYFSFFFLVLKGSFFTSQAEIFFPELESTAPHLVSTFRGPDDSKKSKDGVQIFWWETADAAVILPANCKSIHFHTLENRKNRYSLATETQNIG